MTGQYTLGEAARRGEMGVRRVPAELGRRWLLAIDTSSEQAGIALSDGERLASMSWPAGRNQTVSVLSAIDRLREEAAIETSQIGAVAVASGPGMFSGLRVGMALAKGFVLGLDAALIGVSTFAITAAPWTTGSDSVVAVIPAGRERLLWQVWEAAGPASEPVNGNVGELCALITVSSVPMRVAGELSAAQRQRLATERNAILPPAAASLRHPGVLAELAMARWRAGSVDDPVRLEPVYLHTGRKAGE